MDMQTTMDLERETAQLFKREFLAVLLAGFGNELVPLTSDHGDDACPKALLPVANKPMIDYVLLWVEQSGIKDVLLICPTIHRPALYHHIHSSCSVSPASLHIDLQTFEQSQDSSVGTCTILRHFSSRIPQDFVLLPCDFIPPPSLPLSSILNKFRIESISEGSIATACWFASRKVDRSIFPEEWGPLPRPTPIVWDEPSGTLLQIDTADNQDKNGEEIELRMSMLSRFPRTNLSSSFQDSHVYVCRRSILDLLQERPQFDSFREDFVPWLLKLQYKQSKRKKYAKFLANDDPQKLALEHSTTAFKRPRNKSPTIDHGLSALPSPTKVDWDIDPTSSLKVGIVVHRADSGFAIRVNNIPNFLEVNRQFLCGVTYTLPTDSKNRSLIDQKAQISSDTIIGDSTQVSEKTTIKKSIVGRHCAIGKMVKIVGCVLLDHCVIADGAKLDGCILGKGTKVGSKAELTRCVTQGGYEVDARETVKGEKLEISDWTAAPIDDEDGDETVETESNDVDESD